MADVVYSLVAAVYLVGLLIIYLFSGMRNLLISLFTHSQCIYCIVFVFFCIIAFRFSFAGIWFLICLFHMTGVCHIIFCLSGDNFGLVFFFRR